MAEAVLDVINGWSGSWCVSLLDMCFAWQPDESSVQQFAVFTVHTRNGQLNNLL